MRSLLELITITPIKTWLIFQNGLVALLTKSCLDYREVSYCVGNSCVSFDCLLGWNLSMSYIVKNFNNFIATGSLFIVWKILRINFQSFWRAVEKYFQPTDAWWWNFRKCQISRQLTCFYAKYGGRLTSYFIYATSIRNIRLNDLPDVNVSISREKK